MKKLLLFLFFPLAIFSQTQQQKQAIAAKSNAAKLQILSDQYSRYFSENSKRAAALAQQYHWPLEIKTNDHYSKLIGVTDDAFPVYYMTYNLGAGITARANKLYNGGGLGLSVHGENMIAGVWDGAAPMLTHQLFDGRVQVMDGTTGEYYHASHVTGTIIGGNIVNNGLARGMAFKANAQAYNWDNDLSEVATAAANGLLLSNHSYGYNIFNVLLYQWGKYDITSQAVDEIMYDAPYFQYVCAAGNSRDYGFNPTKNGYDLLTGFAVSKNGIAVGAVHEVLNYSGPTSVFMTDFSSFGPTDDGRIKPDIVAKGYETLSAYTYGDNIYSLLSGTSMAAPSVTGTLLLLQQHFNNVNGSFMKSATLRGLVIHTADEAGTNPGPDYGFGWGLINAEKAANIISKKETETYLLEHTLSQGESFSIAVESNGIEPLVATLCWTDPKGTLPPQNIDYAVPDLVNDLDIRVSKIDQVNFPWKLNPANPTSAATKSDNIVDNVEEVEINNATEDYVVTVTHKGALFNGNQDYSLIVSGIKVKDFWLITNDRVKSVCNGTNSAVFPFELHTKASFGGSVALTAEGLPGGISADFNATPMTASGNFSLTLANLNLLPIGNYMFKVKGQSETESFEMTILLRILSSDLATVTPQLPENNATGLESEVHFSWSADPNSEQYDMEISTAPDFSTIVSAATVTTTTHTETLANNTIYYWRVKSSNSCDSGNFSEIFSFSTQCLAPTGFRMIHSGAHNATIGWTNADSWQIEIVPHGAMPSGTSITINSNPYTANGLDTNTCYDAYFRVACANGGSFWSGPFAFCTQPDYCNGVHFYDSGGPDNNYSSNENTVTTIFPENAGDRVRLTFDTLVTDMFNDTLLVYNGPDVNSPVLYASTWGNPNPVLASTHASGALTFLFKSNPSDNFEGWDATVACELLPLCPFAPAGVSLASVHSTSATIQWVAGNGMTQWETEVVNQGETPAGIGTLASNNPIEINGLIKNTCYDFYVRSVCNNGASDWIGPFAFCTTPDYCNGDHFYDSGGPDGNYPELQDKTVTIYPENAGERIRAVFNSFELASGCCDNFKVYNGPAYESAPIFDGNSMDLPATFASTHPSGTLTFQFYSDYEVTDSGWDATIFCEQMPPCANPPTQIHASEIGITTANLSWSENSNAISWDVEIVLHDATPTGSGTNAAANQQHPVFGLIKNTCYDVYIRSNCTDGSSTWTGPYTFCTIPDYCGGDHFYDSGGAGNYNPNEFIRKTIFPANPGERIRAVFNTYNINLCCDSFRVYNGPNVGYPMVYDSFGLDATDVFPGNFAATYATGALTFEFASNTEPGEGWDAAIICESMPACANPPSQLAATDITKDSVLLTWDENSGAVGWKILTVLQGEMPAGEGTSIGTNSYLLSGLIKNTCYDIYVRSDCQDGLSPWTGPLTFCTQPDFCAGDHFYDTGGATGNYGNFEYYTTVIRPDNEGDRVRAVFNSFALQQCCASLRVYDGPNVFCPLAFESSANGIPNQIASTHPSGMLTFAFASNYSQMPSSGWDASIICEPIPPCVLPPTNVEIQWLNTANISIKWNENSAATSWETLLLAPGEVPSGNGMPTAINNFSQSNLAENACCDFYVRSMCEDGPSVWVGPLKFCTPADYCSGVHFYDTGGANADYGANEHYTKTIFPQNSGERMRAIFHTLDISTWDDQLKVYNGLNTSAPLLWEWEYGNGMPESLTSTHPSGALTFEFYSGINGGYNGWDISFICEQAPACLAFPNNVTVSDVAINGATVSWFDVENDSWEIAVVPFGDTATIATATTDQVFYHADNLESDICYDVYVRSLCADGASSWKGPVRFCTPGEYCQGDHFYDKGGLDGNYPNNESYTQTIYPAAPDGIVTAEFHSFELQRCCDFMKIYSGPDTTFPLLFASDWSNTPGTVTSTDISGALTFVFSSNSNFTDAGWDASIYCELLKTDEFDLNGLQYYPNPVADQLSVKAYDAISDYTIFSPDGRRIQQMDVGLKAFQIDCSDLRTGTYFIKLNGANNASRTIKILKK